MKGRNVLIMALSILGLAALAIGCAPASAPRLKVVTTTSLMSGIVAQIAGDRVKVVTIVPPSQHPGNFDAKPGDIQKLAEADLFLVHGWPGETFVPGLITAANNSKLKLVTVSVAGNWMIPPVQAQAVDKVAAALSQADSQNSASYQKSAGEYQQTIQAKEADIKARLAKANISQVKVIAVDRQADFLQWAGFDVVATYGASESLTPQVVKGLVDKGRAAKVSLVVDNLQSGKDAGKGLAEELGAKDLNLSNFPGGFDSTATWEKAIDRNIELLLGAIAR